MRLLTRNYFQEGSIEFLEMEFREILWSNYQLCLYIKVYSKIHFRKTGENTFEPLSEQELARLSNVEMPESIEIDQSDNNDHDDRSDSDSDGGWETTEEVDDDDDVNGQTNDD